MICPGTALSASRPVIVALYPHDIVLTELTAGLDFDQRWALERVDEFGFVLPKHRIIQPLAV